MSLKDHKNIASQNGELADDESESSDEEASAEEGYSDEMEEIDDDLTSTPWNAPSFYDTSNSWY